MTFCQIGSRLPSITGGYAALETDSANSGVGASLGSTLGSIGSKVVSFPVKEQKLSSLYIPFVKYLGLVTRLQR